MYTNPLLEDKILALCKFKAFADNRLNTQKIKFVLQRLKNIMEKGENIGYHHFLTFPTMLLKGFILRGVKSRYCVLKGKRKLCNGNCLGVLYVMFLALQKGELIQHYAPYRFFG